MNRFVLLKTDEQGSKVCCITAEFSYSDRIGHSNDDTNSIILSTQLVNVHDLC